MNTYADYVEATYGSSQQWLVDFLRRGYARRNRELRDPFIQIHILDTQCGQLGDTNGAYIDAIASQFKLDPMFLCAHFQRCLYPTDTRPLGATQLPITIPSERDFISIREGGENSHMTAAIITADVGTSIARRTVQWHGGLAAGGTNSYGWEWNEENLQALISSRDSIKRYMKKKTSFLSDLASLVEDYDALIEEAERTSIYMQAKLQQYENDEAIKESRKNLQLADSVRRLAVIGVVFIPLSFATSFFGMNLEQLGTGTIHLGYFFLLAALCGALAFVLAACITPIEQAWMRARKRYYIREFQENVGYEWVTKSMIFWAWVRRHSTVATALHDVWSEESEKLLDERSTYEPKEIDHFKIIVLRRSCSAVVRKIQTKVASSRRKNSNNESED
ncbi:hypothetical protein DL95DRAFT_478667 [Leptodontidium sp. 2 PMI_412]|nr:hypothetical protein DL95DRAFT_478667 [Leptodontidium sp. 2 PMI_412]